MPYVGTPNVANKEKYDMTDVAKSTFPVPSGNKILETYGNVIRGKIKPDRVKIAFIIKLNFTDLIFCAVLFPLSIPIISTPNIYLT